MKIRMTVKFKSGKTAQSDHSMYQVQTDDPEIAALFSGGNICKVTTETKVGAITIYEEI